MSCLWDKVRAPLVRSGSSDLPPDAFKPDPAGRASFRTLRSCRLDRLDTRLMRHCDPALVATSD
jgi:hypothetical protein